MNNYLQLIKQRKEMLEKEEKELGAALTGDLKRIQSQLAPLTGLIAIDNKSTTIKKIASFALPIVAGVGIDMLIKKAGAKVLTKIISRFL